MGSLSCPGPSEVAAVVWDETSWLLSREEKMAPKILIEDCHQFRVRHTSEIILVHSEKKCCVNKELKMVFHAFFTIL